MNILVVEDEPKIGEYLKKGLTESGYIVTLATNGIDGRFYILSHEFDLIILGKVRTSIPRTKNENFSHLISMGYQ